MSPKFLSWLSDNKLKFTTFSHPPSLAAKGSAETIAFGGAPNRRAPSANSAPFSIQLLTCSPVCVKVLSGLTRSLHGEINAHEILLHMLFQFVPCVQS